MWKQLAFTAFTAMVFSFFIACGVYERAKAKQSVLYICMTNLFTASFVMLFISIVGIIWS